MGAPDKIVLYNDGTMRLAEIKAFIDTNFDQNLDLKHLCEKFSISNATLRRHFKSVNNRSVTDYIRECRLKQAMTLVSNRTFPVGQIAATVGYSDRTAFTRAFKKKFGKAPFSILKHG